VRKPALQKITPHLIRRMVKRIVQHFDPGQVILFGSLVRGDAGPDSDVDLLVVMAVKGSKLEKSVEIGLALRGFLVPMDIIVTTPEDFGWRKDVVGTIEWPASREGKVRYARDKGRAGAGGIKRGRSSFL
jgi:predicted nucleotidyltransferase